MKYLDLLQGPSGTTHRAPSEALGNKPSKPSKPSTPTSKGLGEPPSKLSKPVLKVLKVGDLGVSKAEGASAAPVGPKGIDAMRRGREAAADEGEDVAASEPEWLRNLKVVPDSRTILIPETVRMKIELIELEARRLGWLPEQLWNADFWRLPRGLAAVLDEDDEIGAVTPDFIEIVKRERRLLRFQRRNG